MRCRRTQPSSTASGTTPSRITLALLVLASLVVATTIVLDRFPEFTSDLLAHVMSDDESHAGHNMGGTR